MLGWMMCMFNKETTKVFSRITVPFAFPPAMMRISVSAYSSPALTFIGSFYFSHSIAVLC